ncbi:MAG TPA: integrase arm-type DNA-binding domain-containing protein [Gammaproteobacteria bacterium]
MLTDKAVKALKPREIPYKKADEKGLYIIVRPDGAKWWRFKYYFAGKERLLSLGVYPDVSLARAREKRDEARRLVAAGIDPSAKRQAEKQAARLAAADTFKAVAEEWLAHGCPPNKGRPPSDETIAQLRHRLKTYVYPYHGSTPIKDISTQVLHGTLKRIVHRGTRETALRVRSVTSRVFRYAVASGRAERDPAADLKDALPVAVTTHFAAVTRAEEIGPLMRAIHGYQGQPTVVTALKLLPLLFVRPGELRNAEWPEFDLDGATWVIPAGRMKMGREHIVPLSRQALALLEELRPFTGRGRLVFPGLRSKEKPLSENTLNAALRNLGYTSEQMTAHGFRSMASTQLNELGFEPDVIEAQLAHMGKDKVRAIYNRADYLQKRRKMMQAWADYLDGLRLDVGRKVVGLRN